MEQRVETRLLEFKRDSRRIGSVDRFDRGEERLLLVRRVFRRGAFKREFDVLGREKLAVLKMDVLAQLESQHFQVRRKGPAFGKQGRHREVAVDLGETLKNIVVRDLTDRGRRARGGVKSRRLKDHPDGHGVFGRGERAMRQKRHACRSDDTNQIAHFNSLPSLAAGARRAIATPTGVARQADQFGDPSNGKSPGPVFATAIIASQKKPRRPKGAAAKKSIVQLAGDHRAITPPGRQRVDCGVRS